MENKDKIILHLCCSEFGSDTKDYRDAGYDVRMIDKNIDVKTYKPPKNVYGIIANPPCTMFSIARSAHSKIPRDLRQGMELVLACLKIIWECQYDLEGTSLTPTLKFWALENPATGLLRYFLGKPAFVYNPWEYGEDFSKKTALWGNFNLPIRPLMYSPITPGRSKSDIITPMTERDRERRTDLRSMASPKFTKMFFLANP